jgi:hypothetical protein
MNTTHLRQRLFLYAIAHLGNRDCSPRQLLRWWLILGGLAALVEFGAVFATVRGDDLAWLMALLLGLIIVAGIVIGGTAAADLRSPVTIEGRVTAFQRLMIKGMTTKNTDRYQYRVTIDRGTGVERIFRAADETHLELSEGDIVRARVGPRLRWIFHIEPIGPGTPPNSEEEEARRPDPEEEEARQRWDRELEARIAADPQAALEELERKRAELEAKLRDL